MCEHQHQHQHHRSIFDEKFLMGIAIFGAICLGEYFEALAVFILYNLGEYLQNKAVEKSRKSITELMDLRPDSANVLVGNDTISKSPEDVKIDDIIIVKTGEKIALDGVVTDGLAFIDTSALTGEAMPREVKEDEEVLSGCLVANGVLKIRVTKTFEQSAVSQILELVEHAGSKKSKTENFITKFARIYTPIVVLLALLIAFIPPLFLHTDFSEWINRALTLLVISCPCALVISVPLGFFAGLGGASKNGILIKGSKYIEALAKAETVVFDKTGTLTNGYFTVEEAVSLSGENVLKLAASVEKYSNHPIAKSITKSYNGELFEVSDVCEIAGQGIKAKIGEDEIFIGKSGQNAVSVLKNNILTGYIILSDELKINAIKTISELKNTVMLSGDIDENVQKFAQKLGITHAFSKLLPQDKVKKLEEIIKHSSGTVLFVGDGINDAPVLRLADVGIAMGGLGSDSAIEASDAVIMNDDPYNVVVAIRIAQKTLKIVKQNIVFALSIKILFLILGTLGFMTMWGAIFADVGVTLIAVLNSLGTMTQKYRRNDKIGKENSMYNLQGI